MPGARTTAWQFTLAAAMGGMLVSSLILAVAVTATTHYHIWYTCSTFPADDEALAAWYHQQDRISNLHLSRDADAVHVRYSRRQNFGSFDLPWPPLDDLGYEMTGLGTEISNPSLLSATTDLFCGYPTTVWIMVAIAVGALMACYYRRSPGPNSDTQPSDPA